MRLDFTIPLIPKAQKRARHGTIKTKTGHNISVTYKDKDQELEENKLQAFLTLLYQHRPPAPLDGPVVMEITAYLPIPKKSKKWQQAARSGLIRPTTKPDWDNLEKHFADCAKGVFWNDDRQVVDCHTRKFYGDIPRWEISIMTLDELETQQPAICGPSSGSSAQQTERRLLF